MAWLHEDLMADIHIIRQDFALALKAYEENPCTETVAALEEQRQRRARAIRSLHRDEDMNVKHLSGMFKTSKTNIREALAAEEE